MIKSSLLIILLTVSHLLFSQELSIINYSTKHGLPSSEIYNVLQDKDGYIWLATEAGVAKFNGNFFKVFDVSNGLSDNSVLGITEDKHGRIWCRTFSGRIHFIENDSIHSIAANDKLIKIFQFGSIIIKDAFLIENDTLLVNLTAGAEFEPHAVKIPPKNNYSEVIPVTFKNIPSSSFRFFSKENYIFKFNISKANPNVLQIIDKDYYAELLFPLFKNWNQSGFSGGLIWKMKDEAYLAVLRTKKVFYIHKKGFTKEVEYLSSKDVVSFCEDNYGNIWVGLNKGGLLFFKDGNLFSQPIHFLSNLTITDILEDFENGMWFSTIENGVLYNQNRKIFALKKVGETSIPKVNKIRNFQNELYLLTNEKSVFTFKNTIEEKNLKKNHFEANLNDLFKGKDKFYFGSGVPKTNLILSDKNSKTVITNSKMYLKTIEGNLNAEKISMADSRYLFVSKNDSLIFSKGINKRIFSMTFDKYDNLLLGTHLGIKILKNDSIYDYKQNVPYRINDLKFDEKGNLWIATNENGVYCSTKDSLFNFNDILSNHKVNKILILKNQVWLTTYGGISKIVKHEGDFTIQNFNTSHGLLSNQITDICFFNNQILINSNEGINFFKPNEIQLNNVRPKTVIKSIRINEEEFKVQDSIIKLDYFQNNLNVEIDVLSFKDPSKNIFKSRLIGYDEEFKKHSNNEVNYTNLSPGYYELWVYGINNDGFESLKPNIFKFKIEKPFWLKWWFIVSEVLIALLVVYLIFSYRIGLVKKEEAEKTAINKKLAEFQLTALRAQMNPHFIFNAISSVQHYVLKNDINQSYDYLAKFSHLIRMVLNNSNQSKIHLDQEIETLRLYISLEKLRFENDFEFFIGIQKDIEDSDISIPSMLIQPFVENAIWHGLMPKKNGCILKLSFSLKNENLLQVIIEDNGIGRVKSKEIKSKTSHKSKGMFLTTERIELLRNNQGENSKVEIVDLYDEQNEAIGTKVILEIQID